MIYSKKITILLLCFSLALFSSARGDLVAFFPFEGDGTDHSDNGWNATAVGSPSYTAGIFGGAVSFNGTTDYFWIVGSGVDALDFPDAVTITLWINAPATTAINWRTMLGRGISDDDGWALHRYLSQNQISFYTIGDNLVIDDQGDPFDGAWHHIAVTAGGGVKTLYIDGEYIASGTYTTMGDNPNNRELWIGNNSEPQDRFWEGLMDDLAIFDTALTQTEIQAIMQEGVRNYAIPMRDDLVAFFPFEGDGMDNSGNGWNATPEGTPSYAAGVFGDAVSLNGTTDYFRILGSGVDVLDFPDAVTVTAWINAPVTTAIDWRTILGRGIGTDDGWALHRYLNQNRIDFYTIGNNLSDGGDPFDSSWHHIALTAGDGAKTLYLDGVPVASSTYATMGDNPNNRELWIGNNSEPQDRFWEGLLDDLAIFSSTLTEGEIQVIMSQGVAAFAGVGLGGASNPNPSNFAQAVDPNLSVITWRLPEPISPGCDGPYDIKCDVFFGEDPNLVGAAQLVDYQWAESATVSLGLNKSYYWRVDVYDPNCDNEMKQVGPVWRFFTHIYEATAPVPADLALDVPVDTALSWMTGSLAESHQVYLSTNYIEVQNRTVSPVITGDTNYIPPETLEHLTSYYWAVDEVRNGGAIVTTGDVWSFTTIASPTATQPFPPHEAQYISTNPHLTWTSGYATESHQVYLSSDLAQVQNRTVAPVARSDPNYDPAELAYDTTYYWAVDEIKNGGQEIVPGDIWQFTTYNEMFQTALRTDIVVLVNSASAMYSDFQHYIELYLKNFGMPYDVLDITTESIQESIGRYSVIVIGHRELDFNNLYLDSTEQAFLGVAVSAGTGLVNFDNDLSPDGSSPRYDFIQNIFGFTYATPGTGSGVDFFEVASGQMHYITDRHENGETVSTGTMTMAGIGLPYFVESIATVDGKPLLSVVDYGTGHAVQWGTYDWMNPNIKGPLYGLDDLVWRSIVWAARKPFVMQAMPPFITMRVDDTTAYPTWVEIANESRIKPWLGLFPNDYTQTELQRLSELIYEGNATASIHAWGSSDFFYWDHANCIPLPDTTIDSYYIQGAQWHLDNNIPISKIVYTHFSEMGTYALNGLLDWGVEFTGQLIPPDSCRGQTNLVDYEPYREYAPAKGAGAGIPIYFAQYLEVPNDPSLNGVFFDSVTQIRDITGYDWVPSNDVANTVDTGVETLKRGFDSLVLSQLFTHEGRITGTTSENWRDALTQITDALADYEPWYPTLDHGIQYARAIYDSDIDQCVYDPETKEAVAVMTGFSDMPTMLYLFTEENGQINQTFVDVPKFTGSESVVFTNCGHYDPGDLNKDCRVNIEDYAVLSQQWGQTLLSRGTDWVFNIDFNKDEVIDMADMLVIANNWLNSTE